MRFPVRLLPLIALLSCGGTSPPAPRPASALPSSSAAPPAHAALPPPSPDGRLSRDVAPTRYALHLTVDPNGQRFTGEAHIGVELAHDTAIIVLQARRMEILRVEALTAQGRV